MLSELPEGWVLKRVHELGEVVLGRQKAPQHMTGANQRPYLRVVNVFEGGLSLSDVPLMNFNESEFETYQLRYGDILLTEGDLGSAWNVGRSAVYRNEIDGCCFQNTLIRFRPDSVDDAEFFQQAFSALRQQGVFAREAAATTVYHLSSGRFKMVDVPVPPALERRKIAQILGSVDEAIRATHGVIEQTRRAKEGLLQELLTKGIGHTSFNQTPLGSLPAEWQVLRLEDLLAADVTPSMRSGPFGSALLKTELVPEGIPLLGIDNVHVERFDRSFKRFVTPAKFAELKRYAVRPNDVMITIMGTVGRCCVVPEDIGPALSSKHTWTLTFDSRLYRPYLACAQLNHAPWAKRQISRASQGGIMEAISSTTIRDLLLPVPSLNEQVRIEEILTSFDSVASQAEKELTVLGKGKVGLLQDLLTGKVRVSV